MIRMTKIAARRTLRIERSTSPAPPRRRQAARRTNSGMTRSLEIMIDSATVSTITMAVAADRPPMKAAMASTSWPEKGSEST